MYLKCLVLLFFFNVIGARYERCPYPHIDNGVARVKHRMNVVKFTCRSRYILMGNKYATCRNGLWDVPKPICIRSGCDPIEDVNNAVVQSYHNNAWMLFFCLPGRKLVGSPVIYCDGRQWNATAPQCVDSTVQSKTTCDFEDPDLCGWKQDELHDFDWRRFNKKTPSSFLSTGPQYDHTFGKNGNGFYMYIESTSRQTNDTARLISPVFDQKITTNSCFVFYYHMYGRSVGGLRVYQKPDKLPLYNVLNYSVNGTNRYLLFEKWGEQGNNWFTGFSPLLNVDDDFQIVIEGIRGSSFMSDIAIDDVGIYQGENCTSLKTEASTPPSVNDFSCVGRCGTSSPGCGCYMMCVMYDNCCSDFLDVCEFGSNSTDDDVDSSSAASASMQPPQTQKLVATTTSTIATISSTSSRTTTPKIETTSTSTTKKPTTSTTRAPTTIKITTKQFTTTTTTPKPTTRRVTPKVTTYIKLNKTTTIAATDSTRSKPTTILNTVKPTTTKRTFNFNFTVKPPLPPKQIVAKKSEGSKAVITTVVVVLVIALCIGAVFAGRSLRGSRGALLLARVRARGARDPEVRFLKSDDDDVDEQ